MHCSIGLPLKMFFATYSKFSFANSLLAFSIFCHIIKLSWISQVDGVVQCKWRLKVKKSNFAVTHKSVFTFSLVDHLHWRYNFGKNVSDSDRVCSCLGHLGRRNKNRNSPIFWRAHRYRSLQNRLLKVCCVPATSASLPRVSFVFSFLFLLLQPLKQTRCP